MVPGYGFFSSSFFAACALNGFDCPGFTAVFFSWPGNAGVLYGRGSGFDDAEVLEGLFGYGLGRLRVAEPAAPFAAPNVLMGALEALFVIAFCAPPTPPTRPPVTPLLVPVMAFVAVFPGAPPTYFFAPMGVLLVGPIAFVFAGFAFDKAVVEAGLELDRLRAGLRAVDGRALPGEGVDW